MGGAAGFGLAVRFLLPRRPPRGGSLSVPLEDIPLDGALVYRDSRVALVRDADGVVALNLVCTHLGCTLSVTSDELLCPCHGSRFDRHGAVLEGPADRPLERLPVRRLADRIEVQVGTAGGARA